MKKEASGSINKILAAILIGVMLILLIGIVVNGWQTDSNGENSSESGNVITDNADNLNGDTDKNNGTADNFINNGNTTQKIPEHVNYLTGLSINENLENRIPFGFIFEPNAPTYGISGSELTVEIPIEAGNTRFLAFKTDVSDLGKIGGFSATRKYVTQLSGLFGGLLVSNGADDIISYPSLFTRVDIDLTEHVDVVYKENGKNVYTDGNSLLKIAKNESIDLITYKRPSLPFEFCDFGDKVSGTTVAESVFIPYSDQNSTSFLYNQSLDVYTLYKNDRVKTDMLNGKAAEYKNVFILFADVVTYETAYGTESIVNTATEGTGYYISGGRLTEIKWSVDSSNNLVFKNLNGSKLTVNRGNSFIAYYKSSASQDVVFQ